MSKRTLRLNAAKLITPFSPGAIVDILGESFITLTAERWPKRSLLPEIDCTRLATRLNVQRLFGPPIAEDSDDPRALGVTVARFPSWLFCQTCRRMIRWTRKNETGTTPMCPHDAGRLVPMRFVVVCKEHSHAADVPWVDWLHRAADASDVCRDNAHLRFRQVEGSWGGLSGLEIVCDTCATRRTLGELRSDVLLREGLRCRGTQPWESTWAECPAPLEVLQRGATSFHYSDSEAAIDIPPLTGTVLDTHDRITSHPLFPGLKETLDQPYAPALAKTIAEALDIDASTVLNAAYSARNGEDGNDDMRTTILAEEFVAFRAAADDAADEANFKTRSVELNAGSDDAVERSLAAVFDSVILVDRLREVRASIGFKRYRPDALRVESVVNHGDEASWLPASEGFGEGIFLRLDTGAVDSWAASRDVQSRAAELEEKFNESRFARRLHPFSAQYVALHSLSHALLREFSFTSGYSAAALRERVYCESTGDYGIFVYTTSSDEEGTLGGLVREGEHDRIGTTLARAAEQLRWCSNDPVCSEAHPQNLDGLNLAACHSCLLASETSCEGSNLLLDRVLLTGSAAVPGLLDDVIDVLTHARDRTGPR